MADISIRGVSKTIDCIEVLLGIDLEIADGESVVLLGASGCGKSTLLRLIGGLEAPTAGRILIGGQSIAGNRADHGRCAMISPHRTFDATSRLSAGPGVQAALARAIIDAPAAVLFDDPLASVDPAARSTLAREVQLASHRSGTTTVFATQDQSLAMALGDRLVVMRDGSIEQDATPREVYDHPATVHVADLVGAPAMNFMAGRLGACGRVVLTGGAEVPLSVAPPLAPGAPVTLGVRPEALRIVEGTVGLRGTFDFAEDLGTGRLFHFEVEGRHVTMQTSDDCATPRRLVPGESLTLAAAPASLHLFDPVTDRRINLRS